VSEVLYRKWRPQVFSEVVGQDAITRTLRNSIASRRLAHAYLFCGPRGTGKTTLGRLLAKAVNCTSAQEGEPCNACDSCLAFLEGRAMDFVEQDAASHNSVDDIRQLRENVILTPMSGGLKVYLLDEVHMLSSAAENALLKTLEEPPQHIIFVLATTEPQKVTPTIVSRCQRFDLRRISNQAVVERLKFICGREDYTVDDAALDEVARSGGGSLRDAINGLEQVVTYYGVSPSYEQVQEALGLSIDARAGELARLVLSADLGGSLALIAAVRDDGADMKNFTRQVVGYLRGLLLAKSGAGDLLDLPKEVAADVRVQASAIEHSAIVNALKALARADFRDDQSSLPLELAVLDLLSETRPVSRTPDRPAAVPSPAVPASSVDELDTSKAMPVQTSASVESGEVADTEKEVIEPVQAATVTPRNGSEESLLDQVRQSCRETDKTLAALLNGSCEVRSVADDHVVLGFYHTFHLERAESEPNAGKLARLFTETLGREVTVRFEKVEQTQREKNPSPGGHLVQAAKELGARPVGSAPAAEGEDYG
jgi:DNA polymerase-3 subunit gamma/tau